MMTYAVREPQATVFVSYSRIDTPFVEEVRVSLETYGFDVVYDQQDIASGEPWEPRLHSLIGDADTTVCVISQAWIASRECVKELDIALKLGRRVIPVIKESIEPSRIPAPLARLQFVFFHGEKHTYARGVDDLIKALRDDIGWVREQSRFLALASDWGAANRSGALLLRGEALERARAWIDGPAPQHVHVLPVVAEFIGQSEIGQVADERRKLRGRIWQVTLGALAVIALLGVGLAFSVADASRARTAEAEQKTLAAIADAAKARAEAETLKADIAAFQAVSREAAGPVATATTTVETEPSLAEAAPSAPAPGRAPASAEPATVSASAARLVAELNAADRSKRLAAGQAVAGLVRSDAPDAVIAELVKELEPPRLQALSAPGRFNVLYTLNLADGARLRAAGGQRLSEALAQIATRAEAGIAIGDQTGDCINSLDEKLAGRPGVAACGGR